MQSNHFQSYLVTAILVLYTMPHIMLSNHGPDDALQQHVSTENTKQCLFCHLPQAQQLYSLETLYLPGYTIRDAVLTIIKERHCIKLTAYQYLF